VYLSTHTNGISLEQVFLNATKLVDDEKQKTLFGIWSSAMGAADKVDALLDALSNGLTIILLDNIEDLLDADGQLLDADLQLFIDHSLRKSDHIRLLLTSQVEMVLPKDLRHLNQLVPLTDGLVVEDGIRLLRNLDPNNTCGLLNAPDDVLRAAVERVRGVPRALEVLAGILEDDRLARLDDVLSQFATYNDVRNMIQEGFRRLDTESQYVITALSVFRRPVLPDAVAYLLEPFAPEINVLEIVQRLIRAHMVSVDRERGVISLHPIDTDYAYSQLKNNNDQTYQLADLECRVATYFSQFTTPSRQWQSMEDLEPQLIAFDHYIKAEMFQAATDTITEDGYKALLKWGHIQRVITMRGQLVDKLGDPEYERHNNYGLAVALKNGGRFSEAIQEKHPLITSFEC
jgi:hypothetical protein